MSYLVLARKYRPKHFDEMMGQGHVLQALKNALTRNKLHHAYLFTGTRGVGKTTVARIFAKCLNCERGITPTPCVECTACQEIDQGRHFDLIEIDAASRTKVEDTREILDNVQYMPQQGRFKIYLIDEVHMLSGHSFNALLKTLEEPPPHVKFLLATTDPEKLPATILSRCLQFHLRNMSPAQVIEQLESIAAKENISYEKEALEMIAKASAGSMRDALSIFDQAIAYSDHQVKGSDVINMLGLTSTQHVYDLLSMISNQDSDGMMKIIDKLETEGADFLALLDHLLEVLQYIAVEQQIPRGDENIKALAEKISSEDIQLYYQISLLGKRDLPLAPDPKSGFIMTMIRLMAFSPNMQSPQKQNASIATKTPTSSCNAPLQPTLQSPAIRTPSTTQSSTPTSPTTNASPWEKILEQLKLTGMAQVLGQNLALIEKNDHQFIFSLDENQSALLTATAKERLEKSLATYYGNPCKIEIRIGKSQVESPAKMKTRDHQEKQEAAQKELLADKNIQTLMDTFSATLASDSIKTTE